MSAYDYAVYEDMMFEEGVVAIAGVMMIIYALGMLWGLASYILQSLGLYTIADRRGLRHPWMAWVPFCSDYLLGCISDHFYQVTENKTKKLRVGVLIVLILFVISLALFIWSYVTIFVELFARVGNTGAAIEDQMVAELIGPMLAVFGSMILLWVIAVVLTVMRYVALYNLYASCWPNCKVGFLLLSIFINASTAILVFICRNKDEGMAPVQRPVYPSYAPPAPQNQTPVPAPQPEPPAPAPQQPAQEKEPWE